MRDKGILIISCAHVGLLTPALVVHNFLLGVLVRKIKSGKSLTHLHVI